MNIKIRKTILCCVLVLCSLLLAIITPSVGVVYASIDVNVGKYTNVLDDLKKDTNFAESEYPCIVDDYSLQLIQVAESNENQLFVYVYQPSGDTQNILATTINISTGVHDKLSFLNYQLTLVNSNGVFYKYIVKSFVVSNDNVRNYDISSIFRAWNEKYDESAGGNNTISEVAYPVAKLFVVNDNNGNPTMCCYDTQVIEITDKYVGFVRYEDGYSGSPGMGMSWHKPGYDSHFVAFSTDMQIDKLYEADVYYDTQYYHFAESSTFGISTGVSETFNAVVPNNYSYIKYTDNVTVSVPQGMFFGHSYSFDRIQTTQQFIDTENREFVYNGAIINVKTEVKLTDEGKQNIQGKQWILRFAETEYGDWYTQVPNTTMRTHYIERTQVSNVTILRLKFDSNGVSYNLGVIDNKQTGDFMPDNYTKTTISLTDLGKILLSILMLILLVILLGPVLPVVLSVIGTIIKILFKVIIWILSIPIKTIKWIFKKRE